MDRPSAGSYRLLGEEIASSSERLLTHLRRDHIGFVFQSFNLIDELTVEENVEVSLLYRKDGGARRKRVAEALERVGVAHRARHRPQQLSGGQQQRVAIARALVSGPQLILADEPTGNLDTANGEAVMDLLKAASRGRHHHRDGDPFAHACGRGRAHRQDAGRPDRQRDATVMLRHFLVTTLRILGANRLQSAIAIFGLSLGLAAAILDGLLIANQLSFDHFIPGHENLYFAAMKRSVRCRSADQAEYTLSFAARSGGALRAGFPRSRKPRAFRAITSGCGMARWRAVNSFIAADPNIFHLLRLPVLYGDLDTALMRPDGIVLPVSVARKYFGRDDVVGQIIEINRDTRYDGDGR